MLRFMGGAQNGEYRRFCGIFATEKLGDSSKQNWQISLLWGGFFIFEEWWKENGGEKHQNVEIQINR